MRGVRGARGGIFVVAWNYVKSPLSRWNSGFGYSIIIRSPSTPNSAEEGISHYNIKVNAKQYLSEAFTL